MSEGGEGNIGIGSGSGSGMSGCGGWSSSFSESGRHGGRDLEYFGWVYHLGVNSIGHEYCHLRFLFLRGKYVAMYKRDSHENPGIKPIRKGVVSPTLMVEELGRRKVNCGEFYVLRFYNQLDETKKGEPSLCVEKHIIQQNQTGMRTETTVAAAHNSLKENHSQPKCPVVCAI